MFTKSDFDEDISSWDAHNVETMSNMFSCNRAFNCGISNWDTSKVSDMNSMFYSSNFNNDISKWNVKMSNICNACFMEIIISIMTFQTGNWIL